MLVERKRVELEIDCLDWAERALGSTGISLEPITPRIAIQSTRLPGVLHGDPAEMLIAQHMRIMLFWSLMIVKF